MTYYNTIEEFNVGYSEKEFDTIIENSISEYIELHPGLAWNFFFSELKTPKSVIPNLNTENKINFTTYCVDKISYYSEKQGNINPTPEEDNIKFWIIFSFFGSVFKAIPVLNEFEFEKLSYIFIKSCNSNSNVLQWPISDLLSKVEKQSSDEFEIKKILKPLQELRVEIISVENRFFFKDTVKLIERIDSLIFKSGNINGIVKPIFFKGKDSFSKYANESVLSLSDEDKSIWFQLIYKAKLTSGAKPTILFLKETKVLIEQLGYRKFKEVTNDWFNFIINLSEVTVRHCDFYENSNYEYLTVEFLNSANYEIIKGFIWMCANFQDLTTSHTIAKLSERCYKKIPNKGPAAAGIGNACFYTLAKIKGFEGIAQLSRLKLRIKQASAQSLIENYLKEAAHEQNITIHEIEDLAVADYDLVDGRKEILFDNYKAKLKITGVGKSELCWFKPDGTLQKTVPSFVKEKHAEAYKELKETQKQIDQTTSAQRDRLDRILRTDMQWQFENFMSSYFEHGLMSVLVKKIIWQFSDTTQDTNQSAIYLNGQWITSDKDILLPAHNCIVTLWHPATESVANIKKWRDFILVHEILQPFKQAYREVYILTDAEINTRTYSNRMASHVLKQHQFNMLAKIRGWKYSLIGAWDGGDNSLAQIILPEYKLRAEYWVSSINSNDAYNDTGIWNYITTDQIRFINTENNQLMNLIDVPAIPFSEILRDVDLFVGVASVGNDPNWFDSGGLLVQRDYWQSYSFGDLSEVAKNRKEILTNLLPRLKIAKVAEIKDKFLVIKGTRRTYKIHLGSTNILMEPNDQYLCIVQDRSAKNFTENLFIPFEGDAGISMILSKAFLLANDKNITDGTINSQIDRR